MDKKTYTPKPLDLSKVKIPAELLELQEAIAENTHEVWAAGRIKEGWKYGPQRNDKKKEHPDLLPYSELPEGEKEYDRATAMNTIKLVLKLGFEIKKKG
ncbi:MAG: Ryanodine receptor Ryr [Bacteroidales bacterium]|nr:Ryanodine receptor Ryr [Bacteroidales bacterium]